MNIYRQQSWVILFFGMIAWLGFGLDLSAFAHDVAESDRKLIQDSVGVNAPAYIYLGAKHMVTGVDHILYLAAVVFFLFRLRDVLLFVSLFAIGHSITLIIGVWQDWHFNEYLVDAIIAGSVIYKALENLGLFAKLFPVWIDARIAVFGFGLIHGVGLATKLNHHINHDEGMLANLISFNIGVELGQIVALIIILGLVNLVRKEKTFASLSRFINIAILIAGSLLLAYQLHAGWVAWTTN